VQNRFRKYLRKQQRIIDNENALESPLQRMMEEEPPAAEIEEDHDPINTKEQLIAQFVKLFKEQQQGETPEYRHLTKLCSCWKVNKDLILEENEFQSRILPYFSKDALLERFLVDFKTKRPDRTAEKKHLENYAKSFGWEVSSFDEDEIAEILSKTVPQKKTFTITKELFNEFVEAIRDTWTADKNEVKGFRNFLKSKIKDIGKDSIDLEKFRSDYEEMEEEIKQWITEAFSIQIGSRVKIITEKYGDEYKEVEGTVLKKQTKGDRCRCRVKLDKQVNGDDVYIFELEELELLEPNKPSRRRLISRLNQK